MANEENDKQPDWKKAETENNIIAFCGERGEGKSSASGEKREFKRTKAVVDQFFRNVEHFCKDYIKKDFKAQLNCLILQDSKGKQVVFDISEVYGGFVQKRIEEYQTIHNDEKYLLWKAEIEAELEKLPQSKTVQDIIHLFSKMGKNFSDDSTFAQLEAKLIVLGKTLSESVGEGSKMDRPHKLFISHSSKDADYVEAFVGLLEILGLRDEEIICSSVPPYCIPLGNKVYEWLVNEFQNSDLHVIYAFSKDYYSSAASLNEMGAAWAMKHKWTGVLLPGFQFNQLDGCIDKTQIAIKLDDSDNRTLKFRLSEFKDELTKEFNLRPMSEATWERQRDGFLDRISTITEDRAKECKNTDESDQ